MAWNLGLWRSLLALRPKKKKNCQRLLRVVVALNQGHTWEGCPQVPTHDVLICLSPFLRPEKNEKKIIKNKMQLYYLLLEFKTGKVALISISTKDPRVQSIITSCSHCILIPYLILWCKTCHHLRICGRFLKQVERYKIIFTMGVLLHCTWCLMIISWIFVHISGSEVIHNWFNQDGCMCFFLTTNWPKWKDLVSSPHLVVERSKCILICIHVQL